MGEGFVGVVKGLPGAAEGAVQGLGEAGEGLAEGAGGGRKVIRRGGGTFAKLAEVEAVDGAGELGGALVERLNQLAELLREGGDIGLADGGADVVGQGGERVDGFGELIGNGLSGGHNLLGGGKDGGDVERFGLPRHFELGKGAPILREVEIDVDDARDALQGQTGAEAMGDHAFQTLTGKIGVLLEVNGTADADIGERPEMLLLLIALGETSAIGGAREGDGLHRANLHAAEFHGAANVEALNGGVEIGLEVGLSGEEIAAAEEDAAENEKGEADKDEESDGEGVPSLLHVRIPWPPRGGGR